ncbi:hypothetical protein CDAR_410661 [Caerostris darwini]|uniref:Uncharacterized protein n=1 Tax=Caerostris darwini TaxID=1538125 RepID=A0AAV4P376_9ARAC|nr:hypothetical protein CDAR_410661 [Caerostris darwini]
MVLHGIKGHIVPPFRVPLCNNRLLPFQQNRKLLAELRSDANSIITLYTQNPSSIKEVANPNRKKKKRVDGKPLLHMVEIPAHTSLRHSRRKASSSWFISTLIYSTRRQLQVQNTHTHIIAAVNFLPAADFHRPPVCHASIRAE